MEIQCRTCGEAKPSTSFWRQPGSKLGFQTECKTCMKSRNAAWHRANRGSNNRAVHKRRQKNPLRCLLINARQRARKNGCEFTLDVNALVMPERCPILGIKLQSSLGTGKGRFQDCSPSIDRIDNCRGYTPDNVVIISWRANRLKGDASLDELCKIAEFYRALAETRGSPDPA